MRFASLGSGSSGNALLVEVQGSLHTSRVLVDCGFGPRVLARRLAERGLEPSQIDAVFVTHEHSDHCAGVLALARRHGVRVIASAGSWEAMGGPDSGVQATLASDGEVVTVGEVELRPFAVPHDSREPLQLVLGNGAVSLGVATDLGEPVPEVLGRLQGCDALVVECNHDAGLLADGPYPAFLKRRVGGARGHLANHQGAALLRACMHARLRHVVAAHLSLCNNRPALAAAALCEVLACAAEDIVLADAGTGTPWLSLD